MRLLETHFEALVKQPHTVFGCYESPNEACGVGYAIDIEVFYSAEICRLFKSMDRGGKPHSRRSFTKIQSGRCIVSF